jgi:S-formylglutathione hydrolase
MPSHISLGELRSQFLREPVLYSVLTPDEKSALPLCIVLLGGGTRKSLIDLQPLFDDLWSDGTLPPMAIATLTPGHDYYLEEPGGAIKWDSFLIDEFIPDLRSAFGLAQATVVAGISAGGYGALKLAFAHPHLFTSVAAMQPMLEPALRESDVRPRNRLHHAAGGPAQLIGANRDPVVWELNNPANRARLNSKQIRETGLAIYLEAGDHDFLNAHDGTEFLHRILWDLDISHEYHLVRGADHGGPTMRPRLRAMFAWIGSLGKHLGPDTIAERAAAVWLESGMLGEPPAGATGTRTFLDFLRARFDVLRSQTAQTDPTASRRFGQF